MILLVTLLLLLIFLTIYYLTGRYNENYWKKRGVAFYEENKVLGPMWDFLKTDDPVFLCLYKLYKIYRNEPAVGIGSLLSPTLYVTDLENVQHVLQTDFRNFNHRGLEFPKADKMTDQVLFMHGNRWKLMRQAMTPLFSNSKIRNMYYIIDKSAQDYVKYLIESPSKRASDVYDTLTDFCAAAVSGAIFGISTQSIFDSPFAKLGKMALAPSKKRLLYFGLNSLKYNILKKLNLCSFSEHEDFLIGAISQVLAQREKDGVGNRHDFADVAVPLKKAGKLVDPETGYEIEINDDILAAQAFFYYSAGVETTASAMYATLLELGRHPDILDKVNKEIDDTWENCNGQLTADIIKEMKYLDQVFSEALRMHPPIGFLTRLATQPSVLPVGNIKVEAGTKIYTPIYEIHHDEKYFPDPEKFVPERFAPANKDKLNQNAYMPFGKGGRYCIGQRYGQLQAKAGLVHLLRHFDVETTIKEGGIKHSKQIVQVRLANVKVNLIYKKYKSV